MSHLVIYFAFILCIGGVYNKNRIERKDQKVSKLEINEFDSLLFQNNCISKKEYKLGIENVLHKYFVSLNTTVYVASNCKDTNITVFKGSSNIDYLNGNNKVLEFKYKSKEEAFHQFGHFVKEYKNNKRRVDDFYSLKPGFILTYGNKSIYLILINDCISSKLYSETKRFVLKKNKKNSYLISRCGLNIEN